jgi:hypothetical protein
MTDVASARTMDTGFRVVLDLEEPKPAQPAKDKASSMRFAPDKFVPITPPVSVLAVLQLRDLGTIWIEDVELMHLRAK